MYESLIDLVNDIRPKKVRLLVNEKDLPFDIRYYIDTINIFYDLSRRYGSQKFATVEFHLELGMWYWNFYNYLGQKYIEYANYSTLKSYKKDKRVLWDEVKKALFDYWLEISTNKELEFYGNLGVLKVRVLLCGAMYDVNPKMQDFLNVISKKIAMEV